MPFAESADKDRYLITYADLITLLLGLFIILYAISNIDNKKYSNMIQAFTSVFGKPSVSVGNLTQSAPGNRILEVSPTERLKSSLEKVIGENDYSENIVLEENERGLTVRILDKLLFAPGNADLTESSKRVLSNLAVILREVPNDIRVEGHTDNTPINTIEFPSNWHLSVARSLNTAYYLTQTEKLNPDKVSIVGNGEFKPITDNDSPEHRSQNRRVDIVIITK